MFIFEAYKKILILTHGHCIFLIRVFLGLCIRILQMSLLGGYCVLTFLSKQLLLTATNSSFVALKGFFLNNKMIQLHPASFCLLTHSTLNKDLD